MERMLVRDIDWAHYGIEDPAHTDTEWDREPFRHSVGDHPCTLQVRPDGTGYIHFRWRTGVFVNAEQVARLIAEVFTDPFYHRYPAYAVFPRDERIYQLPGYSNA